MSPAQSLPLLRGSIIALSIPCALYLGMKVGSDSLLIPLFSVMLIVGAFAIQRPQNLLFISIALLPTQMTLPILPQNVNLHYLCSFGLLSAAAMKMLLKPNFERFGRMHTMGLLLAALLVMLMITRGLGLYMLGSTDIGGMRYFHILSGLSLIFCATIFPLRPKMWKMLVPTLALTSLIPVAADLLYIKGLAPPFLASIISPFSMTEDIGLLPDVLTNINRLLSGNNTSVMLTVCLLVMLRPRNLFQPKAILFVPFFGLAGALAFYSGFRLALIKIVLIVALATYLDRALTFKRMFFIGATAVAVVLVSLPFADQLPLTFQRALTFIPFVELSPIAEAHASDSMNWRLEVWRRASHDIPRYLLIGKGLTFNGQKYIYAQTDNYDWALINSTFHNGPLSMLILLGIPGVILSLLFFFATGGRHLRLYRQAWNNKFLKNLHLVLFAYFIMHTFTFLFLYGDVQGTYPHLFVFIAMMESVAISDRALDAPEPVPDKNHDQLWQPRLAGRR